MYSVYRKAENNKKWPNGGGPSENERKSELKEITKVASHFFRWVSKQIFFSASKMGPRGML